MERRADPMHKSSIMVVSLLEPSSLTDLMRQTIAVSYTYIKSLPQNIPEAMTPDFGWRNPPQTTIPSMAIRSVKDLTTRTTQSVLARVEKAVVVPSCAPPPTENVSSHDASNAAIVLRQCRRGSMAISATSMINRVASSSSATPCDVVCFACQPSTSNWCCGQNLLTSTGMASGSTLGVAELVQCDSASGSGQNNHIH